MSQEVSRKRLQKAWHERYGMTPEQAIEQGQATIYDWLRFVTDMRTRQELPYEVDSSHARILLFCRLRDLTSFDALAQGVGLTNRSLKAVTLSLLKEGYLVSSHMGKQLFFSLTSEGYDLAQKLKEVEDGQ